MEKNIIKIVSIVITLTLMNGSIVPVFAKDNSQTKNNSINLDDSIITQQTSTKKPILTLDKAISAAIANSDKLALKSQEILMYRNKMKLQDKTNDFYESINQKVYDFPYDKLELQEKQTDQTEEFLQDQITSDITNKYNSIIMKQIDISESKSNLEIKTKDLNTMKIEVTLGLATANQLDDKQIEIKTLQDDIQSKENSLNDSIDYLGVLINLNLSNYTLDQNISYDVFKIDGSIDSYIDDKIDVYFKYNDKMIDLTKDYLDELKDDGIKDIFDADIPTIPAESSYMKTVDTESSTLDSGSYALAMIQYLQKELQFSDELTAYGSYLDTKYNMDEAKVKLADSKKNLKNGLKESYSTLLDLENKISRLNDQIKSTNSKLSYAKIQVSIGTMTENDYNAQVLKSEKLNTSLRNLINTYNNLKNVIEKPWILDAVFK